MIQIDVDLVQPDYGFEAKDAGGHTVRFDTTTDHGGQNYGVRPMQSLLMGLATCSGIDVVSILKKMRQSYTGLHITVQGEREKDKVPAIWETIHMTMIFTGEVDEAKARQAVGLSIDKYCSVAETLRRAGATITWDVVVNAE